MTFQKPDLAFAEAIRVGRLTENPKDKNFAGNYMYMGTDDKDDDLFKNIETRQYLPQVVIYPDLLDS